MNPSKNPARRAAWAAAKTAEVRRQMQAAEQIETGSDWRKRAGKARLMESLRARETRLRRLATLALDDSFTLPF